MILLVLSQPGSHRQTAINGCCLDSCTLLRQTSNCCCFSTVLRAMLDFIVAVFVCYF